MQAPFDLLDQQFLEAFQNYTASGSQPADTASGSAEAVARSGGRGRPSGIVFPGRAPPVASNGTFITGGEQDNSNIGVSNTPRATITVRELRLHCSMIVVIGQRSAVEKCH